MEEKQFDDAKLILGICFGKYPKMELQNESASFLISMEMESTTSKEYSTINLKLQELFKKYGISPYSLDL